MFFLIIKPTFKIFQFFTFMYFFLSYPNMDKLIAFKYLSCWLRKTKDKLPIMIPQKLAILTFQHVLKGGKGMSIYQNLSQNILLSLLV